MHEPGASPVGGVRSRRVVSTPNCITITSTRRCGDLERKEARIFQEHISCSVVISIDDERTARTAKHLGATECRVEVSTARAGLGGVLLAHDHHRATTGLVEEALLESIM